MSSEEEAAKEYYAAIMTQLLESEKFLNWFGMNYDLHKRVDEEEKTFEILLIEVPPEEVQKRMMKHMTEKVSEPPSIVAASPEEVDVITRKK